MGLFEDDFDTKNTPETLLLAIRRRFSSRNLEFPDLTDLDDITED